MLLPRGSPAGSQGPGDRRGPEERGGVSPSDGAVPVMEPEGSFVLRGAALPMLDAWGGQGAAGAACFACRAALGRTHRPGVAVQPPAMLRGTARPGWGGEPAFLSGICNMETIEQSVTAVYRKNCQGFIYWK